MRERGRIPDALTGVYCRDRPDPQFDPPGSYHALVGDGMIHGFYLEPNAAGRQRDISQPLGADPARADPALGSRA